MYAETNVNKDDILYEDYNGKIYFYKVVKIDGDVIELVRLYSEEESREEVSEYTTIIYLKPLPDEYFESIGSLFTDIEKDPDGKHIHINGIKSNGDLLICKPGETIPQYEEHYS